MMMSSESIVCVVFIIVKSEALHGNLISSLTDAIDDINTTNTYLMRYKQTQMHNWFKIYSEFHSFMPVFYCC